MSPPPPERTPFDHGLSLGEPLPAIGRAHRCSLAGGGELWRFRDRDDAAVARLLALGADGIGGFVAGGRDDDGAWLHRSDPAPTLAAWWTANPGPVAWREAIAIARTIASILVRAEGKSLVPGRIGPTQVAGVGGSLHLRADVLVASLCGAPSGTSTSDGDAHARWLPPEQAAGASWDAAANRYALGLLLYRCLAGEHPFSGKGLRRGIDDRVHGAPPLPDAIAASLPPGLQSLCLRLLDGDPTRRPAKASDLASRLVELADGIAIDPAVSVRATRPVAAMRGGTELAAVPRRAEPRVRALARRLREPVAWMGIAIVGVAIAGVLVDRAEPPAPAKRPEVGAADPLAAAQTTADDCIACHPDHAMQWHLSVMAHSVKSPLFQSLEMLIEEQVGRDFDCPEGAGILRPADARTACRDRDSGLPVTGSGGELWCVNCHAPGFNLAGSLPAWDGRSRQSSSRRPVADLLGQAQMEGISCAFCHQTHGPVRPGDARRGQYEGNPTWRSTETGEVFFSRPEDRRGTPGIANSGYSLDPAQLLVSAADPKDASTRVVAGGSHLSPTDDARAYLRSSEFCGACHDVRLFGTDVLGVQRGEHFKRLRNAYSEWAAWADDEVRAGRTPASCQDCHMSAFPGVCVADGPGAAPGDTALARGCPPGTRFSPRRPGEQPQGQSAIGSAPDEVSPHYFTGVDIPLADAFPDGLVDETSVDDLGIPRGARARRDLLLGATFRFELEPAQRIGDRVEVPLVLENIGGGHRVPAGFSQEREIWVHLRVSDADGRTIYEVGRVDRADEDLQDKRFLFVNLDDSILDEEGRPLGLFGADIVDGPDVPQWSPPPDVGARDSRGRGLVNLQNGFLRCVRCIGFVDAQGRCQPGPGQGRHRADRFADGAYDPDTGVCESNLFGGNELFEIYFPVGALDATRGLIKGPDAIVDTRSAPPNVARRYTYDLRTGGARGPLHVEARLLFRAFPPFLVRAFADYEARMAARGKRPSGPLVTRDMLDRLEVVEIARREQEVP